MNSWQEFYSNPINLNDYLRNLHMHSFIFERILEETPSNILEVGVGTGSMSIFLSHLGLSVKAVDNNQEVLNNALKLNDALNGSAQFIEADAYKLSEIFSSDNFDLVFSQGFFEHFNNNEIENLINEQLKVSRLIFISIPSIFNPSNDFGDERLLSIKKWKEILGTMDLNVDFIVYYGYSLQKPKHFIKNMFKDPKFRIAKPFHILIKIKK